MRIAHVATLPPARSGIADYAARIADALAEQHEVIPIEDPASTEVPEDAKPLYQIGNNALHASAYRAALERPGVVVLHDATLHHMLLGELDEDSYMQQFGEQYGVRKSGLAGQLWAERGGAMQDPRYFDYGLTGALVRAARAVIVHNPEAAHRARQAGARQVYEVPHFVEPAPVSPTDAERSKVRTQLGVADNEVLFGVFGYLRPAKRVASIVHALTGLDGPWRLLICGDSASPQAQIAQQSLPAERVVTRPYLADDEWWPIAAATDVCLNLRYPSAAETSGIALRMMSLGIPNVVTRGREWARFPEGALIEVDSGESELPLLREFLELLSDRAEMRSSVGAIAREHVLREHTISRVVAGYEKALEA